MVCVLKHAPKSDKNSRKKKYVAEIRLLMIVFK